MTAKEFVEKHRNKWIELDTLGHKGWDGEIINWAISGDIRVFAPTPSDHLYFTIDQLTPLVMMAQEFAEKYKGQEAIYTSALIDGQKNKCRIVGYSGAAIYGKKAYRYGVDVIFSGEFGAIIPVYVDSLTLTTKATTDMSKYPHKCNRCGAPCYIGFSSVDCSAGCK